VCSICVFAGIRCWACCRALVGSRGCVSLSPSSSNCCIRTLWTAPPSRAVSVLVGGGAWAHELCRLCSVPAGGVPLRWPCPAEPSESGACWVLKQGTVPVAPGACSRCTPMNGALERCPLPRRRWPPTAGPSVRCACCWPHPPETIGRSLQAAPAPAAQHERAGWPASPQAGQQQGQCSAPRSSSRVCERPRQFIDPSEPNRKHQ
jgi:hypothetical protein